MASSGRKTVKVKSSYNTVYVLLGISPASNCSCPTFRNPVSVPSSKPLKMELTEGSETSESCVSSIFKAFEDGTDRRFRNVGQLQFDAGEIPKRTYTIFKSRRKFEIKNSITCHEDTEGGLRHGFALSLTSALEWGRGVVNTEPLPLYSPRKKPGNPLYRRLSGIAGRSRRIRKTSHQSGFERRMVQPVASRYTDYAIIREVSRSYIGYYPD